MMQQNFDAIQERRAAIKRLSEVCSGTHEAGVGAALNDSYALPRSTPLSHLDLLDKLNRIQ